MMDTEIKLSDYAKQHGKDPDKVRRLAQRGGFRTAYREDGEWVIEADEPYPDDRRPKPSQVLNFEPGELTRREQNSLVRGALVRRLSNWGTYQDTFCRMWDRLTPSLVETCTPEQLAQIIDLLKQAYDDGRASRDDV